MADSEEESGLSRTKTAAEPPVDQPNPTNPNPLPPDPQPDDDLSSQPGDCVPTEPVDHSSQPGDFFQSCPEEQSTLVVPELSGLSADLMNTTIIYVQSDGSLVEGSGLTVEEQQALLEQLTKQQIVQVSDTEAAQLLQQSQIVKTISAPNTALAPNQLQQVIDQVTKSQQQVQFLPQSLKQQQVQVVQIPQQSLKSAEAPGLYMVNSSSSEVPAGSRSRNNASLQLKNVAQQAAMQTGGSVQVVQKKVSCYHVPLTHSGPELCWCCSTD